MGVQIKIDTAKSNIKDCHKCHIVIKNFTK